MILKSQFKTELVAKKVTINNYAHEKSVIALHLPILLDKITPNRKSFDCNLSLTVSMFNQVEDGGSGDKNSFWFIPVHFRF